jgi:hypothetical protein
MPYALQPDQVIGIADRLRRALDETLACSDALRDTVDALSTALSGATPAHAAFDDGAEPRVRCRAEWSRTVSPPWRLFAGSSPPT